MKPRNQAWEWGNNCRVMDLTINDAEKILDQGWTLTDKDIQDFWDGFYTNPSRSYLVPIIIG